MYTYLEELLDKDVLLERMSTREKNENFLSNVTANKLKKISKNVPISGRFNGVKMGKNGFFIDTNEDSLNGNRSFAYASYTDTANPITIRKQRRLSNGLDATALGLGALGAGMGIQNISKLKKQLKDLNNPSTARKLYKRANTDLTFDKWVSKKKKQIKTLIGVDAVSAGVGGTVAVMSGRNLYKNNKKFKPVDFNEDVEFLMETMDIPYIDEY